METAATSSSDERSLATLPHCVLHRVFRLLSTKDLSLTSAVCRLWKNLNHDSVGERRWKEHYASRWPLPAEAPPHSWARIYSDKVQESAAYKGRFFQDSLFGHRTGVRSIRLCSQSNLLATGSLDRTVRLWDLDQGMLISTSRLHEGTVRALALAKRPSTNNLYLVSAAETSIRLWSLDSDNLSALKLKKETTKLNGHSGPVADVCLRDDHLFSGSWDCSVCMWRENREEQWTVASRYVYGDWVWSVDAKRRHFVVSAGRKVIVQSIETGQQTTCIADFLTEGHITSCRLTEDEHLVITGSTDGAVRLHDFRCRNQLVEIETHGSGVTAVAFEDPWVAAGSLDGTISLTNIMERLHPQLRSESNKQAGNRRHLHCQSGAVYSIDMQNQWIACGAEQSTVRTWDFTRALAAARKAQVSRMIRKNRKNHPRLPLPLDEDNNVAVDDSNDDNSDNEATDLQSDQTAASCRFQHRRTSFWNSFGWGDSTDDSEIIDAFG